MVWFPGLGVATVAIDVCAGLSSARGSSATPPGTCLSNNCLPMYILTPQSVSYAFALVLKSSNCEFMVHFDSRLATGLRIHCNHVLLGTLTVMVTFVYSKGFWPSSVASASTGS